MEDKLFNGSNNITENFHGFSVQDIRVMARSYTMYKIGLFIFIAL